MYLILINIYNFNIIQSSGAKNAKTKNTKIQKREFSEHHLTAMVKWTEYKKSCRSGNSIIS